MWKARTIPGGGGEGIRHIFRLTPKLLRHAWWSFPPSRRNLFPYMVIFVDVQWRIRLKCCDDWQKIFVMCPCFAARTCVRHSAVTWVGSTKAPSSLRHLWHHWMNGWTDNMLVKKANPTSKGSSKERDHRLLYWDDSCTVHLHPIFDGRIFANELPYRNWQQWWMSLYICIWEALGKRIWFLYTCKLRVNSVVIAQENRFHATAAQIWPLVPCHANLCLRIRKPTWIKATTHIDCFVCFCWYLRWCVLYMYVYVRNSGCNLYSFVTGLYLSGGFSRVGELSLQTFQIVYTSRPLTRDHWSYGPITHQVSWQLNFRPVARSWKELT